MKTKTFQSSQTWDNPLEDKLVKNAMSKISTKKRKLTNAIQEKKERDGSKDNFER